MTSTNMRLAAAGLAALLGLGLGATPSAAATELVPFHAGHDHSADKAESDKGKGKDAKKAGKKGKKKDKCPRGHHHDDGHDHGHACH